MLFASKTTVGRIVTRRRWPQANAPPYGWQMNLGNGDAGLKPPSPVHLTQLPEFLVALGEEVFGGDILEFGEGGEDGFFE